ncbi:hypothetical protein KK437_03490 [Clostridioides difficile]|nr:hypothetical protein [Clostridioides difficile]
MKEEQYEKDTSHIIKRAEHFQVILIGEGLMVGAVAGLIVLLYRILLGQAGTWLSQILKFVEGSTIKIIAWFAVLAVLVDCIKVGGLGANDF